MTKRRIEELDIAKGLGIIYVVMRHLCEYTGVSVYGQGFYSIFNSCTECVMVMFILLSGYVFKSKGKIGVDIKNKVKQLLVPYLIYFLLFTMTYLIIYVFINGMDIVTFLSYSLSNLLADYNLDFIHFTTYTNIMRYAFCPFWYIAEIFVAFILFIIVNKLLEKRNAIVKIITSVVMLLITMGIIMLDLRGFVENTFSVPVSFFTVVPNIIGFAALLLIGNLLKQCNAYDIEAQSNRVSAVVFAISLILVAVNITFYDFNYAFQYGKWGSFGVYSVIITTITGVAFTYCLIMISYFIKKIKPIKVILKFLGQSTLDILLLHCGVAEILCMVFGFWYPVYDIEIYPKDGYAWWHFVLVLVVTLTIVISYILIKNNNKKRKIQKHNSNLV